MNTTAIEQIAGFGKRTLPGIFGLQNEAFERLQKLTQLNLAAMKAVLEEGQSALSPQQAGQPAATRAVGLSQRFVEHSLSYSKHVREIDSQFMAAMTRAGEDLGAQYNALWTQAAANFGQFSPFGSGAASSAMQSAIGGMMRAQGMMQETISQAAGTRTPGATVPDIA